MLAGAGGVVGAKVLLEAGYVELGLDQTLLHGPNAAMEVRVVHNRKDVVH
jgi:hypothetical protein